MGEGVFILFIIGIIVVVFSNLDLVLIVMIMSFCIDLFDIGKDIEEEVCRKWNWVYIGLFVLFIFFICFVDVLNN